VAARTATGALFGLVDRFPAHRRSAMRIALCEAIRAIMAQRLVPTADNARRVPAIELIPMSGRMVELLKDEPLPTPAWMENLQRAGMRSLDQSLSDLVNLKLITKDAARKHCDDSRWFS
jgi:Tfp pilus assembly pilus retraction ATPase PilT